MPKAARPKGVSVHQLKVTLLGVEPPVWRRLLVAPETKLSELHHILQAVMEWENDHLHDFTIDGRRYGGSARTPWEDSSDEARTRLSRVVRGIGAKFRYTYDFGDSWEHEIVVEDMIPAQEGVRYPICVAGERAGPPEDVGGAWGYSDFLQAIGDPEHPDHEDMLCWVGGSFDPEAFDIEQVNKLLRKVR